ncbi:hypothetical protein Pan44_46880 [Caulifigura coniformis]|uniref:Uncharacterized protein n=1 Tax=Caulifigura coniformis TaxID=2527983 RepID=A0A517SKI4_9PLAN|nr:hypothetical protein Pan44_46880 [Caulifigura coniformis]
MARWPDNWRSNAFMLVVLFAVFPALCWLAMRWVGGR